jgi:hypothetical protein
MIPDERCMPVAMTRYTAPFFDLDDRARLSERFYGAARTVLARL